MDKVPFIGAFLDPFSTAVGQKIELATDGSLPSENWALNMEICDMINSNNDAAKDAIKAIKKRLVQSAGKNYTIVMYTLTVLETCVKNCGKQFHVLVCNKEFISELVKLIGPKNDPPTVVQEKVLSLIQFWADAFQNQPDLQGVTQVYQELKSKGVEFPMTDLDAMAPIFTPQRSVPDGGAEMPVGSPQRAPHSPQRPQQEPTPVGPVNLTASQASKLRADLAVVEGNMQVMAEMLNEMVSQPPAQHHASDLDLLNELAATLKAMQARIVELVGRVAGDGPLTGQLLHANDELNNLLLRHARLLNKGRSGAKNASPAAILGAAMGVPAGDAAETVRQEDDSLIDLSDDIPDVAKLSVKDSQGDKSPASAKDEFDMFAQSRNLTYESSKAGGSTYADNLEPGQSNSGLAAVASSRPTQRPTQPTSVMDQREIDEIAAWLEQEKSSTEASGPQESVTSSDFEKFLAERAAAAENLPSASENRAQNQTTPRHRQIKKDDQDSMFAL